MPHDGKKSDEPEVIYYINTKSNLNISLKRTADGFIGICAFLLFSWGSELCVDSSISNNRQEYRI
jgi:hypothetical protein